MPETALHDFRGPRRSRRRRAANRERLRGGCFIAVGVVAFALLLTVALVFAPTVQQVDLSEPQKTAARQALDKAEKSAQALQEAAKAGQPREEELALTEDAVNLMLLEKADASSRLAEHGLSEPTVRIADGRMAASAKRIVGALPVTLTVTLKPRMAGEGSVRFDVSGLALGRLSIPTSLAQRLADEVARSLETKAARSGLVVTAARVRGHELLLWVRARPGGAPG